VLGNARMARGDLERAIASFERAIEIDPTDADALNSLGIAYSRLGRYAEAGKAYRAALDVRPMLATWANLGLLEAPDGDPDEAEHALRTGLEGFPADANLRLALAQLLHRVARGEEAVLELERLLGHDPAHAQAAELRAAWLAEQAAEPAPPVR
jgi:Flp pilus assembly protein TadD